jgi:copper(I)-binding protein
MNIDRRRIFFCALTAGAAVAAGLAGWPPSAAQAREYAVGKIKIEHPWLRAPLEGETRAQLYMLVSNAGDRPDRLIAVKSADFGSAQFHIAPHFAAREEAIYLPPLSKATLAPGGSHVELVDISKMNPVGEAAEMTLVFEQAGAVAINASVEAPDAMHAQDAEAAERWRKMRGGASSGRSEHIDVDRTNEDATRPEGEPALESE